MTTTLSSVLDEWTLFTFHLFNMYKMTTFTLSQEEGEVNDVHSSLNFLAKEHNGSRTPLISVQVVSEDR
jgi:hypothetical protein